ncbi:hypothetical protein BC943DRAFT_326958 [Umbelopsis sp. AD052]|nr:hypothetical protein BC943DRAFT_326958 [Umbelopsis sp. AD052]
MTAIKKAADSLSYLNDYSDTTEALPLELHRNYTLIRQLDESAEDLMSTVADECKVLTDNKKLSREERLEKLRNVSNLLNETVKRGEEKFALAKSTYDTIDRHCSRLDNDLQKFEDEQLIGPGRTNITQASASEDGHHDRETGGKKRKGNVEGAIIRSSLTPRNDTKISKNYKSGRSGSKKREKKSKTVLEDDQVGTSGFGFGSSAENVQAAVAISDMPVDPNEPVYCFCRQVSYGEMVACDNDECEIEWFHLPCVKLTSVPRGKWYCDNCAPKMQSKLKRLS